MAKLDKLIDYAYLKEECDIPQNIPDADLEKKIYRGQEMLRMIMGDEFYRAFLTAYRATPSTAFSTAYQSLYDPYIKQFVAWQAYEFYSKQANFKPTRSGFRVHSEENSVVASDAQMGGIIKDANQTAQYYKQLMYDFLNGHSADYPLYSQNCNNNLMGNAQHISAVRKKHGHDCGCNHCRS